MPARDQTIQLRALAAAAGELLVRVDGDATTPVSGVAYDSRAVARGDLFFCVPGTVADGHVFAPLAATAGASALMVERPTGTGLPEVVVADGRRAMARMAARYFGDPAQSLTLLGVTGTNGKTTTAWLLEAIVRAAGASTGLIGTIETRVAGVARPGVRTTPESVDLQRLFAEMRQASVDTVVMEVTSHALALHRVESLLFDCAAFTNLSQDHLDFHRDMEDYFNAKRELFVDDRCAIGAVNVDDPYGRRIKETAPVPCIGFGISPDADVRPSDVAFTPSGTELTVNVAGDRLRHSAFHVESRLVGAFNVSNCLAAASVSLAAGIDTDTVRRGLKELDAVPGRFEAVDAGQPFTVVVDYAHTPDSLDNVLREARRLAQAPPGPGRVICMFGAGGDRDRGKRPLMGAVVARLADVVVVTSDNPRSEDPEAIIGQILEGIVAERAAPADVVEMDRRTAIAAALGLAARGDVVVVAGKGHESGQEFHGTKLPFDDRLVVRETLRELGWAAT
jgi:UDP-N-acetylmuramoyl-L-alanyl-D-glutamate--2,6-diaminopimelate ligase